MATVKFRIRGSERLKLTSIYVRFRANEDIEKKTNLHIKPIHWSAAKEQMKISSETGSVANGFNLKLRELKTNIINSFNLDYAKGIEINSKWLAKIIDITFNQHSSLSEEEQKSVFRGDPLRAY
jgi:hypothetical protein